MNARNHLRVKSLVSLSLAVLMAGAILFRPGIAHATDPVVGTPTSLTFAGQAVGTQSAAQTLTYTNGGTVTVTIPAPVISQADGGAAPFLFNPPQSGTLTIAPMESVSVQVAFAPTSAGTFNGSVTATVAGQSDIVTALTGTAVGPELSPSATPLTIGNVAYAPGQQVMSTETLTNMSTTDVIHVTSVTLGGTSPSYFTAQPSLGLPVSLPPGAALDVVVTYTPTAAGAESATLTIVSDDPVAPTQTIPIIGEVGDPLLTPASASAAFPSTAVGSSSTQTIVLTDTGFSPVTITGLTGLINVTDTDTLDGGLVTTDFSVSGHPVETSLSPNASVSLTITFTPHTGGTKSGVLSFLNNDPSWPPAGTKTFMIAGPATGGFDTLFPATATFTIPNDTSSTVSAVYFSNSTTPVKIQSVAWQSVVGDADAGDAGGVRDAGDAGDGGVKQYFTVVSGADIGTVINPSGGAAPLVVQFQASQANVAETDTLLIGLDDPNQTVLSFPVSGTGVDGDASAGGDGGPSTDGGDGGGVDAAYCPLCTTGGDSCTCSQVGGADRALALPLVGATAAFGLFVARRKRRRSPASRV